MNAFKSLYDKYIEDCKALEYWTARYRRGGTDAMRRHMIFYRNRVLAWKGGK